jgi:carbon storage regulator CsrA
MLVLTRKQQETIQIGENVTITVVRIKGNTVRVGIEAPRDVRVARGEVFGKQSTGKVSVVPTTDAEESSTDEPPADSTGEQTIDRPAAPWQAIQSGRRAPQRISGRGSHTVPTHAV